MAALPRPSRFALLLLGLTGARGAGHARGGPHSPGRSLAQVAAVSGELRRAGLGADVAVLGDLDGDGIRDWAAGRSGPRSQSPEVRVFSGASGALLYTLEGRGQFASIFLEAVVDAGEVGVWSTWPEGPRAPGRRWLEGSGTPSRRPR